MGNPPKQFQTLPLRNQFSVYHGGAVGLIYGKATPTQYEDSIVLDPTVISVRDRIIAEVSDILLPDQATIVVMFQDATSLEKRIEHAVGSLEVPMGDEQLEKKFIDQAERVLGKEGAQKASAACWGIREVEDVESVAKSL